MDVNRSLKTRHIRYSRPLLRARSYVETEKCSVPWDSYEIHKAHDIQTLIQRSIFSLLQQITFKIAFIHPRENHWIDFVILVTYFPFKLNDIGMMEFVQDFQLAFHSLGTKSSYFEVEHRSILSTTCLSNLLSFLFWFLWEIAEFLDSHLATKETMNTMLGATVHINLGCSPASHSNLLCTHRRTIHVHSDRLWTILLGLSGLE